MTLGKYSELANAFRQVILADAPVELPNIVAYKLESIGLVSLSGNLATPSRELYRLYFQQRLDQF